MKLLIVTQKVDQDDAVLGFMHAWITEFAKQCEKVTVICLYEGKHELPSNVKVLSLGKEKNVSRVRYLLNFLTYIFTQRKEYDVVFVHMNQLYIILAGLIWKMMGKKVGLWYAHGHVPFSLRYALIDTDIVFTSTKSGFRINSPKVNIIGQGIDTQYFTPMTTSPEYIVTIGRISPVKNYETLIEAAALLKEKGREINVCIVGGVILPEHEAYLTELNRLIVEKGLKDSFVFTGPIPNHEIKDYLSKASIFVNMSLTGSLDKAMLEAMAMEVPVISCNDAFKEVFPSLNVYTFEAEQADQLARQIQDMLDMPTTEMSQLKNQVRMLVVQDHSLKAFIAKIINLFS